MKNGDAERGDYREVSTGERSISLLLQAPLVAAAAAGQLGSRGPRDDVAAQEESRPQTPKDGVVAGQESRSHATHA